MAEVKSTGAVPELPAEKPVVGPSSLHLKRQGEKSKAAESSKPQDLPANTTSEAKTASRAEGLRSTLVKRERIVQKEPKPKEKGFVASLKGAFVSQSPEKVE